MIATKLLYYTKNDILVRAVIHTHLILKNNSKPIAFKKFLVVNIILLNFK